MNPFSTISPYEQGMLDVGDDNSVYWEVSGNPEGKPAVVLHGGPGSGSSEWSRRLFDATAYRIVQFDQRNCGRSLPSAISVQTDLSRNTTWNLVADIERLRQHLSIDRWLVMGGSWGSTLALTYAETHPDRVSELVLFGVGLGRQEELDWLFRGGLSKLFPEEWHMLCASLPNFEESNDITDSMFNLLHDSDPAVRQNAANAWCLWESATPDWPPVQGLTGRFQEPAFAYSFARLVNHYVRHDLWLDDDVLLRNAGVLAPIPGVLINGRFDFQSPLANAWAVKRQWASADLIVVNDAGHSAGNPGLTAEILRATERFATP